MKLGTSKNKTISKVITYVSHVNWKHIALFFIFLVISFAYWMSLFIEKNVKHKYTLPVKYTNVPEDIAFDTPLTDTFTINIESKGSSILNNSLFNRKPVIEVNVSQYINEQITEIQGEELKKLFREKLLLEPDEIRGYYPISIPLKTSKLEQKEVSVAFDGEISTAQNNLIVDILKIEPHKIIVYGTANQLKNLNLIQTEHTVIENLKTSSDFEIKLRKDTDGIKYDRSTVTVHVPILTYTERKVEIPIVAKNIPVGRDVKFFPSQVTVSFSVTLDDYKKISPEDFSIELDYVEFYDNENARVDLQLTDSASSARNIKISPSTVEFLIEKR